MKVKVRVNRQNMYAYKRTCIDIDAYNIMYVHVNMRQQAVKKSVVRVIGSYHSQLFNITSTVAMAYSYV